ncbi:MAG: DUF4011 domain-containing protein, partial [Candidatus Bathyarchaeota archaeon]
MNSASLAKVYRRVEDWKLKLIDLSKRNRLVNFKPTRRSSVNFDKPGPDAIFNRLVVRDRAWEIWEPPEEDSPLDRKPRRKRNQLSPHNVEAPQLRKILRNLSRRSASEYRERGIRILYITFGMLSWNEAGSRQRLNSPLVLTPVELTRKTSRDPYKIQVPPVEEEAILNPALRLKLEYDHKLELPRLPDFQEETLTSYLREVEGVVEELGWEVEHTVQLGLFSFHKLVMYQDLTDNMETIVKHPLIKALAGVSTPPTAKGELPKPRDLDSSDPKTTYQVLDADSSQQLCIQYALAGQSFVMHGPPGTGKSQTIANMIAEFIARGKRVLFVSEKMAALEVVHSRLEAKNLSDYCLELHSHKANKREVVAELSRALNEHLKAKPTLTDEELERLVTRRDALNRYVDALHTRREPIGMTAYQLFGILAGLEGIPLVPPGYTNFETLDQRTLLDLEDKIRRLSNAWAVVEEGSRFPWRGCKEERFTPETRSEWIHLLESAIDTSERLEASSKSYSEALGLKTPSTIGAYQRLRRLTEMISTTPRPPQAWLKKADLKEIRTLAEGCRKDWDGYHSKVRELEKHYDTRLLILPPGTAKRIKRAYSALKELLAPISRGDGGLLMNMKELEDYLRELHNRLQGLREEAEKIRDTFDLRWEVNTLEKINRLSRLAALCREESRPPRAWLDKWRLDKSRELIEELRESYTRRDEFRESLRDYEKGLMDLNLEDLIEWYEGPGSSFLRIFRPRYYRIREDISRLHKNGVLTGDVLEDLKAAKELRDLEAKLESGKEQARRTLQDYFRGDDPDFKGAEEAMEIAEKVIRISGRKRTPKALRDNLCSGTEPGKRLVQIAGVLNSNLEAVRSDTRRLRSLIPSKRIPQTGKPMRISPLQDIVDWADDTLERLSILERGSSEALATRISGHPQTFDALIEDLNIVEGLQRFEDKVDRRSHELHSVFGRLYSGLGTDWDGVLKAIGWTQRLIRTLPRGVPDSLVEAVSQGGKSLPRDPRVEERWASISKTLNVIDERFEGARWPGPRGGLHLAELRRELVTLRGRVDDLQTWVDFQEEEAGLREEGLGDFLNKLVAQKYHRDQLVDIFQKSMYQGLLDMVFRQDSALEAFRGQDHEQLIDDFRELDRRFVRLNSQRVIKIANQQKPQGVFVQAPDSEITILMREAAKKRRHMPLRHLFERIPSLIRRLKPCLMMSPISVSQFLIPSGIHFDLVVFDEASQIY